MGNKDVVVKNVKHPGTRPQPFIRPALRDDLKDIIIRNLRLHVK